MMQARFVAKKGATKEAVEILVKFLRHLGHVKVCMQADSESGLLDLVVQAQQRLCQPGDDAEASTIRQVRVRTTGGWSSPSNGHVERAHGLLKGMVRTLLSDVQVRMDAGENVDTTRPSTEPKMGITVMEGLGRAQTASGT